MWSPVRLDQRECQDEVQDRLDLDPGRLMQALRGLQRINAWSGAARIFWQPLASLMRQTGGAELSILDLGCGAGDQLIALCQRAAQRGWKLHATGCDRNPKTLEYARQQADRAGVAVRFFPLDLPQESIPDRYDVVICSLLLHHMQDEQVVPFLEAMGQAARRMVMVNDLRRSATGWWLAYWGTRLLGCGPVNRVDSLLSVQAALTLSEARVFVQHSGWTGATIQAHWPCRYLITWRKP